MNNTYDPYFLDSSMSFTAPAVPDSGQIYMPENTESFAEGLWYIIKTVITEIKPEFAKTAGICLSLIAIVILVSIVNSFSQKSSGVIKLTAAVVIGIMLLEPSNSMVQLGVQTITRLSEYGKLLFPVMTAAMSAQGGITTSAALYTGTVIFSTFLVTLIESIIVPVLYIYLTLSVATCAIGNDMLTKIRNFAKWAMTWCLKTVLYVFTGYISITRVISGSVDASTLKITKMTISSAVPVIGSILSDASEAILVSAGFMKNSAGIYGIFAVLAVCVNPFLQISMLYFLLKLSAAVCNVFGSKETVGLIQDFSTGMGYVLAMTGTVCLLHLISLVCFVKGIGS